MSDTRMQSRFHRKWLVASLLCAVFVLMLTHIPQAALPRVLQRDLLDKAEHVAAYAGIAFLFLLSLPRVAYSRSLIVGLLTLAGIGMLDEVTQPLVHRYASLGDYACDLVGIALACTIFLVKKQLPIDD